MVVKNDIIKRLKIIPNQKNMINKLHAYLTKVSKFVFQIATPDKPDEGGELPVNPPDAQPMPTSPNEQVDQAASRAAEMLRGGAQQAEQLGTNDRPRTEGDRIAPETLREWSKGYPEVTEFGNTEQTIIAECKRRIINRIKQENLRRRPEDQQPERVGLRDHQTIAETELTGGYEYVFVYDTNHTPPERLFKSPNRVTEATEQAAQAAAETEDVTGNVDEYFSNSPQELTGGTEYTRYANMLRNRIPNHGDVQSYIYTDQNSNETAYVALRDKRPQFAGRGGVRIFKGSPSS